MTRVAPMLLRATMAIWLVMVSGACNAIIVRTPPLRMEELPGTWVSPASDSPQVRLTISKDGTGTLALADWHSSKGDYRVYRVIDITVDGYDISGLLAPASGGGSVALQGSAESESLKLRFDEHLLDGHLPYADEIEVSLVPEANARALAEETGRLQRELARLAKDQ